LKYLKTAAKVFGATDFHYVEHWYSIEGVAGDHPADGRVVGAVA
jgi:hypothetical protein